MIRHAPAQGNSLCWCIFIIILSLNTLMKSNVSKLINLKDEYLGYIIVINKKTSRKISTRLFGILHYGAGSGNRTHVISFEG